MCMDQAMAYFLIIIILVLLGTIRFFRSFEMKEMKYLCLIVYGLLCWILSYIILSDLYKIGYYFAFQTDAIEFFLTYSGMLIAYLKIVINSNQEFFNFLLYVLELLITFFWSIIGISLIWNFIFYVLYDKESWLPGDRFHDVFFIVFGFFMFILMIIIV